MTASLSWLERCPLPLAIVDRGGGILYWSSGAERITGWSWDEIVGRRVAIRLLERTHHRIGIVRQLRRRGRIEGMVVSVRGADGRVRPIKLSVGPLMSRAGEVAAYLAIGVLAPTDSPGPSLKGRSDETLAVVEKLQQGIVIEDASGYITYANQAALRLFQRPLHALLGRHWTHLVSSSAQKDIGQRLGHRRLGEAEVYETEIVTGGGRIVPVLVNARPQYRDSVFAGVLAEFSDLGQVRSLERRLRRAERAGATAILLQGLAHDLANLLSVVLPQAEMLACDAAASGEPRIADHARRIQAALERGGDLVGRLADCRCQREDEPSPLELTSEIAAFEPLLTRLAAPQARISFDLPSDPGIWARIHAIELQQILINLVTNACAAVEDDGEIRVAVGRGKDARLGPVAFLCVEDDGEGIAPELLDQIFEPFVTTKPAERAGGLGLHMVRSLVDERGGAIHVRSDPGRGSRFEVELPEVPAPTETPSPERGPEVERVPSSLRARVLVVEDDPDLAQTIEHALSHLGHEAVVVRSAANARSALEAADDGFDVALIDEGLPDASGRDLREQVLELSPQVRTILCSGSPPEPGDDGAYLRKPFTLQQLDQMIARAGAAGERQVEPVEG